MASVGAGGGQPHVGLAVGRGQGVAEQLGRVEGAPGGVRAANDSLMTACMTAATAYLPPRGMGAGAESDISLSVSVSSRRSWWEWAWRGRERWEEQRALRLHARRAGLELRCLHIIIHYYHHYHHNHYIHHLSSLSSSLSSSSSPLSSYSSLSS